jgi:hypothetical protein
MNLTVTLESAELRFKQILEEFFIAVYDEKKLPSHGINHHRRVWRYSKELFTLFAGRKPATFLQLPSKLIIASYLHDIGMSVETGIRHGKHSSDICKEFLKQNNISFDDYQDVLKAIKHHDNKDYNGDSDVNDLLTILTVADDLDAFGFTGIYRYSEIYLMREISMAEIGHLIMINAEKRFNNFVLTFGFADEFVMKHKKRYIILDKFFSEYNKQIGDYKFGGSKPSGYCGVIEVLNDIMRKKIVLKDVCRNSEKLSDDPVICWFFNELAFESIN